LKIGYKYSLICAVLVLLVLSTISASASLEVSGSRLEADVSPGDRLSHEITVTSLDSNSSKNMSVDLLGYGQGLDGAVLGLQEKDDNSPYSARSFLEVSPAKFDLQPNVPQNIILNVTVPYDVVSGSRYALAFIHGAPVGDSKVKIITGMNVPVILNIKEGEKLTTGTIESLLAEQPISSKMLNTSLTFKNTGNTRYNIFVEGLLKDEDGNVVAEASESTFTPILPTYSREVWLQFNPDQELLPGNYLIKETVKLEDGIEVESKEINLSID